MDKTSEISNFGRNVRFTPGKICVPRSETELLTILRDHRHGHVRVIASRHAWSSLIETDDALIDMRHFCQIRIHEINGQSCVTVGAGCPLKMLLKFLNERGLTTPSVGLITEQTVAGATATGTHGSGKHSLSHYVVSLRIACFDESGEEPRIVSVTEGFELRAARCSLGCLGVVVDVTLPCIPQYYVREKMTPKGTIEKVLALEANSPLQQFFLVPHSWTYFAQERSVAPENHRSGFAAVYRVYWFLSLDVGLHLLIVCFAAWLRSRPLIRLLFRRIVPCTIFPRWVVVDRSDRQLVMKHELFRHLEQELFVRRSDVIAASHFVADILRLADDPKHELQPDTVGRLKTIGSLKAVESLRGTFTPHYPICFRRILPEDTLFSMASGSYEDWYFISFLTYVEPRDDFFRLATFLADSMSRLFEARVHWGKWFPLEADHIDRQYPAMETFREVCRRFDPRGVFRNRFVREKLRL